MASTYQIVTDCIVLQQLLYKAYQNGQKPSFSQKMKQLEADLHTPKQEALYIEQAGRAPLKPGSIGSITGFYAPLSDCHRTTESMRLDYEFCKISPSIWKRLKVDRYYGNDEIEEFFYHGQTVNEFLELRPESFRIGYKDNVFVPDEVTRLRLKDLQNPGNDTAHFGYATCTDWVEVTKVMERDIKWAVRNEIAPCTRQEFYELYMKYARVNSVAKEVPFNYYPGLKDEPIEKRRMAKYRVI